MKYYIDILREFQRWNPELVEKMKNCSHHFDSRNLSPFHIEDDVWTHTMLMYKDFMILSNGNSKILDIDYNRSYEILLPIIILCHDAGKVYTRQVPNNGFGKIAMYGHSFASIQVAIDFIEHLKKNDIMGITEDDIYKILNVISNHMDYFNASTADRVLMANYDINNFALGEIINYLDHRNSLDEKCEFIDHTYKNDYWGFHHQQENDENADITIYCGVPGSGKDYIAEMNNDYILSYDYIRVEAYKNAHPERDGVVSKAKLYEEAFHFCNENKIDLNQHLKHQAELYLERGYKVSIANTNLTRKSRRSLVNLFHKYNIKIIYVISDSSTLFERNNNRNSKNLDRLVMNKFVYNQQVPSMFDFKNNNNVKEIQLVYN